MPTHSTRSPARPRPARPPARKLPARVYRRRRIAAALAALLVPGLLLGAAGWGYTAFRFRQIGSVHVPGLGSARADGSVNLLVIAPTPARGCAGAGSGRRPGSAAT
jgi:hypothetical protein